MFTDRWKLIDADTLPAYLAFLRDHPDQARAVVATPLSQRVTGYRLLARAGQLAAAAFTHWDLDAARRAAPAAHPQRPAGHAAASGGHVHRSDRRAHPRVRRLRRLAPAAGYG